MKHIHFDLLGGASGDMLLAACIALGADPDDLQSALSSLPVAGVDLHVEPADDHGIHGTRVTVHTHEGGDHSHHHHADDSSHPADGPPHSPGPPHRNLHDIHAIIDGSTLPAPVKAMSRRVFTRLAEAEATIHGSTVEAIHFHEVGAMDSIADIIGSCLGLHLLGAEQVSLSAVPMGHGTIQCAHGIYPNPAPATVALLAGTPTEAVDEPFEMVTPTGAALLTSWKTADAPPPGSRLLQSGYAIGHRSMNQRPNVLRAMLFEPVGANASPTACTVLECNLDDTTPELVGALTERLLHEGAWDVFTAPIQMKKQRPGILLTVLCDRAHKEPLRELIFAESTTFGIRESERERTVLERRTVNVDTPYGPVRIKLGSRGGAVITRAPEMDDCIARAHAQQVAVRTVYQCALSAAHNRNLP